MVARATRSDRYCTISLTWPGRFHLPDVGLDGYRLDSLMV
jgi:hypothetical protein